MRRKEKKKEEGGRKPGRTEREDGKGGRRGEEL